MSEPEPIAVVFLLLAFGWPVLAVGGAVACWWIGEGVRWLWVQ